MVGSLLLLNSIWGLYPTEELLLHLMLRGLVNIYMYYKVPADQSQDFKILPSILRHPLKPWLCAIHPALYHSTPEFALHASSPEAIKGSGPDK